MKKFLALLLAGVMLLSLAACSADEAKDPTTTAAPATVTDAVPEKGVIRLSTTTSVNDSGLLPYLLPYFEEATGYSVEVTSNGTGAAIKLGETGDADLLLVHAKASEEEFIANGYATERIPFMYNYFVIVGPANDPAGIKSCANAAAAFEKIEEADAPFVSRGDDSGTHKAELKIWKAIDENDLPGADDEWYISAGAGMGATLNQANERLAYALTDKATYLSNKDNLDLEILLEKGDDMKNTYSLIAVNSNKNPEGVNALIEWMTKESTLELIKGYGVSEYGQSLFFVDM